MARLTEPNFVKSSREHRGLTQAELGDATGGMWRLRLARLLDVRPGDLTPAGRKDD